MAIEALNDDISNEINESQTEIDDLSKQVLQDTDDISSAIAANTANISDNSDTIDGIIESNQSTTCINGKTLTGELCGEWVGATLRRLRLWGEDVPDDEITFEFPTED